jgi:hypothetical protein
MEIFVFLLFIGAAVVFWGFRRGQSHRTQEPVGRLIIETRFDDARRQDNKSEPLDRDHWEGRFEGASDPRPVHAVLAIVYVDGSGAATERTIDVRKYDEGLYGGCIMAFCRLREANRTFRFDRIQSAIDIETGEVLEDVRIYLRGKYEASPAGAMDQFLDQVYDAIRALFFIGKADGRLTAKEKAEILTFCHTVHGDTRIDLPTLDRTLKQMEIPTTQAYRLCCGRLAKELPEDQKPLLIATAERMIATTKTVAAAKQEALDYLRKRLAPPPQRQRKASRAATTSA